MQLTRGDIREIVGRFLAVLDREGIISLDSLGKKTGQRFPVNEKDSVELQMRPFNKGTEAYTASYLSAGMGTPVEFRINPDLGYSVIMVKFQGLLDGYSPFSSDGAGNTAQDKRISSVEMSAVRKELEKLV